MTKIKPTWECHFCMREFKREKAFMKHQCREMIRAEEIKNIVGMAAYKFYSDWMTSYNRKVPSIETFTISRYYEAFKKFYYNTTRLNMPDPSKFIELMHTKDICPTLWCSDECYSIYLEWLDRRSTPVEQAEISVKTIYKLSDNLEVNVSDVFKSLNPREIIELFRLRQLSPWLLLCSIKFKEVLISMETGDKKELLDVIGFAYWSDKFEQNPESIKQMKKIAEELGI